MSETIQTKHCPKCNQIKSIAEFNKSKNQRDKLQSYCKTCQIISQRNYLKTEKGKETHRKGYKKYSQTEKGKTVLLALQKSFRIRHPERYKAHSAVNNAVARGRLSKAIHHLCHYCPKLAQQYHHWRGYKKEYWLDVIPVCRNCNTKLRFIA